MKLAYRTRTIALALLLGAFFLGTYSHAADANISATLILASNAGDGVDASLRAYEGNLKRLFKYSSYKMRASSSAKISESGSGTINLGGGHQLQLTLQADEGNRFRVNAKWVNGRNNLISTTLNLAKGRPAILGGPSVESDGGNLILIIVAR